jgi:hypothetical protein
MVVWENMGQAKRETPDGSAGKIKSETHPDISCYNFCDKIYKALDTLPLIISSLDDIINQLKESW